MRDRLVIALQAPAAPSPKRVTALGRRFQIDLEGGAGTTTPSPPPSSRCGAAARRAHGAPRRGRPRAGRRRALRRGLGVAGVAGHLARGDAGVLLPGDGPAADPAPPRQPGDEGGDRRPARPGADHPAGGRGGRGAVRGLLPRRLLALVRRRGRVRPAGGRRRPRRPRRPLRDRRRGGSGCALRLRPGRAARLVAAAGLPPEPWEPLPGVPAESTVRSAFGYRAPDGDGRVGLVTESSLAGATRLVFSSFDGADWRPPVNIDPPVVFCSANIADGRVPAAAPGDPAVPVGPADQVVPADVDGDGRS